MIFFHPSLKLYQEDIQVYIMRLGEIATLELVKLYMQHECLWDPSHKYYRSKGKRTEAYKAIVVQMEKATNIKLDANEVKTKLCHLRSTYAQEIKKIINRSTDPNNIYKPNVPWFPVMDNCLKNLKCIKSSSDDNILLDNTDTMADYWPDAADVPLDENNSESNDANNCDPLNDDSGEFSDVKLSDVKVELQRESHKNGRTKRKRSSSRQKERKKSKHKSRDDEVADIVGHLSNAEDEYDIYGRYIAAQLRKIASNRAITVQLEMHRILSEARLNEITKFEE